MTIKCYCGFVWEDRHILRGHEEDEGGIFFRCPVKYNDNDQWDSCMGHVAEEYGNGILHRLYPKILKRYHEIKKEQEIKKIQKTHKFTLDIF